MNPPTSLAKMLLILRVSVFAVFFVWSLDKFIRPEHASAVFTHFYFSPPFGAGMAYAIGAVQLLISIGFLLGFKKRLTYGAILVMHAISTFTSYKQYLNPYDEINILFFAAWPMLAAALTVYVLRDQDVLFTPLAGR